MINQPSDLEDFGEKYIAATQDADSIRSDFAKRRQSVEECWAQLKTAVLALHFDPSMYDRFGIIHRRYNKELATYAWKLMQTRAFGYNIFPPTCLVPVMDFLNHGPEEKLVFAVRPLKFHLQLISRSLRALRRDPPILTKAEAEGVENGDLHYDESADEEEEEKQETSKSVAATERTEEIWDPTRTDVFVELRSQRNKPYYFSTHTCMSSIKKGEELRLFYGERSNRFLLCEYGFCLPDNKYDYYRLAVSPPISR